jgi:hypothetical protein
MGYVPGQLQARLALIEIGTADPNSAAREVQPLIQDATRLRFRLLARKAEEVEHPPREAVAAH